MNTEELYNKASKATPTDVETQVATHRISSGKLIACHIYPNFKHVFLLKCRDTLKSVELTVVEANLLLAQ